MDIKGIIRKGVLFNRRLLSPEVYDLRNALVVDNALTLLQTHGAKSVHCFLPIKRNHEVDTWPIIRELTNKELSAIVSATDFDKQTMAHFDYNTDLVFENDRFGIPTPVSGRAANLAMVDTVLIPLLASDKCGNRIGYGKGYYDRMLAEMSPNILKVGLTLGTLFDHFSFAEPHDISLDYVITPFEIVKCELPHQD